MANPLKDWKHGKKGEESPLHSIPLSKGPEWVEETQLWKALLSKAVDGNNVPKVVGKFFHWDGTLYEAKSQEHISDYALLRKLQLNSPLGAKRAFFYVYLEEIDSRLALTLGRKKSNDPT